MPTLNFKKVSGPTKWKKWKYVEDVLLRVVTFVVIYYQGVSN